MNTASYRMFPIMGGAACTTFGLFLLMQGLVAKDMMSFPEERPVFNPNIILDLPKEPEIRQVTRVQEPPKVVDPPVIEDRRRTTVDPKVIGLPTGSGVAPKPNFDDTGFKPGYMDGERLPLVRVQAQYPRPALERGIEGSVVVEFTVREDGTVADARVLEADPKGVFDRSALAAIAKFKYKPTVVDGIARASTGIRYRFVFELTE